MVDKVYYDKYEGRDSFMYVLHGDGIEVGLTDFGAALQYVKVKIKREVRDICLGYSSVAQRAASGSYSGSTIGRVANRIGRSRFSLAGKTYNVSANDGDNCNHGGKTGFDKLFFELTNENPLTMSLVSEDGDMGFPGRLELKVEFTLEGKEFKVRFEAESDTDTVWAPTFHPYFNLSGASSALDSLLWINAEKFTPLDKQHIATGEIRSVKGTPFDFTSFKPINRDIDSDDIQLMEAGGYDHNFVLNGCHAATACSPEGDLRLDIYTDMPGLQLYTGNYLKGMGKTGKHLTRGGFCLEPQWFPNAVNIEHFATPILTAGEKRSQYILYKFDF